MSDATTTLALRNASDGWSAFSHCAPPTGPLALLGRYFDNLAEGDPPTTITQRYVADLFTMLHGNTAKHSPNGGWHLWDGLRWRRDTAGLLMHDVSLLAAEIVDRFKPAPGVRRTAESAAFATGAERMLRVNPTHVVGSDYFDADPDLLGLPSGGAWNLRKGYELPPDPEHRITRALAAAPDDERRPDRWLAFLREATGGDTDLVAFLQRWAGYCLTGHTSEHALLFLYGPGGSGKSTFVNTLAYVLGDYAVTAPMSTFTATYGEQHPTDLAGLVGARLVTATETEEGRTWAEAKLKQVTGGDPISARFMRQDFFTYRPVFKLCVVGNHLPTLRSADTAMRRRFRVAPFDHPPTDPDHHLEAALRAEAPYILEWALEGAFVWYDDGLGTSPSVELETSPTTSTARTSWANGSATAPNG